MRISQRVRNGTVPGIALMLLTVSLYAGGKGNLVPNPGFEKGRDGKPAYWMPPDGLTTFWSDNGVSGKCMMFDTDVYRSEWEKQRRDPDDKVQKTEVKGKGYNTVGGTTGVAVYSYPIAVKEDAWYLVEYDMKATVKGEPFIYLKGFWECEPADVRRQGEKLFFQPAPDGPAFSVVAKGTLDAERRVPRAGDYIQSFRRRFIAKMPSSHGGKWHRYRGVVQMRRRSHVSRVLLELYAYWPRGKYFFDNISMREITEAQAEKFEAWKKENPEGQPVK